MYEYDIPEDYHIDISNRPDLPSLMDITIAIIGDLCAETENNNMDQHYYELIFSAQYFNALLDSKKLNDHSDYLKFLAGVSYYLAGLPGSARVLLNNLAFEDLTVVNIQKTIIAFIYKDRIVLQDDQTGIFSESLSIISECWDGFLQSGIDVERLSQECLLIKQTAYRSGSDRELLLSDMLCAVLKRSIETSGWVLLPRYTNLDISVWRNYLQSNIAIKEFWPSQVLLGENGVFAGQSAVLQMPTSSGKTKASELIIRSAFMGGRANLAVIIAPFRALCQEITNTLNYSFKNDENIFVNLLSDVLQNDFDDPAETYEVIISTPEKFDYLLKHTPELADRIGLIIYDEAHLFDDDNRGVKYELLLASLKDKISETAQVIVISAVMPNAEEIGSWLIGENPVVVTSNGIGLVEKRIAFVSWTGTLGRLEFTQQENIEASDFFVPRVLESQTLLKKPRERVEKTFPVQHDGIYDVNQIALFLGIKLVRNGMIALYTGRKDSVSGIANTIVDSFNRRLSLTKPSEFCDADELRKIISYTEKLLGDSSYHAQAAHLGILCHHGSVPHALRLAIEHSLSSQKIKFVICTSTLAQGVNLPIKYLIVANERPGQDNIKIRDFHNLMGRTGRSGYYTEGTVLFANAEIYDKRFNRDENWRWKNIKRLVNPDNSENCVSHLLKIVETNPPAEPSKREQWEKDKLNISNEIKLYLLTALSDLDVSEFENTVTVLATNTLAFHQADEQQKSALQEVFKNLAREIAEEEPEIENRKAYSKTVVGLSQSKIIVDYLNVHEDLFQNITSHDALMDAFWPILFSSATHKVLKTFEEQEALSLCKMWISGIGFAYLKTEAEGYWRGQRKLTIDNIVDLCESGFGYNISLVIASCIELMDLTNINQSFIIPELLKIQKQIKYGLQYHSSIVLYELGFTDRDLAREVADIISFELGGRTRSDHLQALLKEKDALKPYINENYPSYFSDKFKEIIRE